MDTEQTLKDQYASASISYVLAVSADGGSSGPCVESPLYLPNTINWCTNLHASQSYVFW